MKLLTTKPHIRMLPGNGDYYRFIVMFPNYTSGWQKSVHGQSGVALHIGERTSAVRFDSHSRYQYEIVPTDWTRGEA